MLGRTGGRGPLLTRCRLQLPELPPQGRDLDVSLGHRLCDAAQYLVGGSSLVSPQRPRRAQQRDVRCGRHVRLQRRGVRGGHRHLPAPANGSKDHRADDHGGGHEQQHRHNKNGVMGSGMTWQPPRWPARTALIAAAATVDEASAAIRAGADLVQLPAESGLITTFLARHPGVSVYVAGPADGLAAALAAGATAICADAPAAGGSGVLVEVPLDRAAAAVATGLAVLVDADRAAALADADRAAALADADRAAALADADRAAALADADRAAAPAAGARADDLRTGDLPAVIALAALACWLGAAAVRTRHVAAVRRALDMAESIRGTRPPVSATRGLA
jgi:dihydropteroate synthase